VRQLCANVFCVRNDFECTFCHSALVEDVTCRVLAGACRFSVLVFTLLGRLFDRVHLIKPVSNVRPSARPYVRTSIRPRKVTSISMKFGIHVEVDE